MEPIWAADRFRLFLSHTSAHKTHVHELSDALSWRDIDGFVAHDSIEPTQEWQDVIEQALATCDALLAWLTPDFPSSRWTDQEVGFCVGRGVLIIPARVGQDPYGFIGKYQGLQVGAKTPQELAKEIEQILVKAPATAEAMAMTLVHRFSNSGSYSDARQNFRDLAQIAGGVWTADLLDEVERATQDNPQITNAWEGTGMLRDRVEAFLDDQRGAP
jgi:hypothetical protein